MDTQDEKFLESVPDKAPRSKLEPHLELIRGLRKKRRTFVEISQMLNERFSLRVAASTIHNFLKVRERRRERIGKPGEPLPLGQPAEPLSSGSALYDDEIETLRRRPLPTERVPKFSFVPGEPLRIPRKDKP